MSRQRAHSEGGTIISMNNSNDIIGKRNSDLPGCSTVPKPTAPPSIPSSVHAKLKSRIRVSFFLIWMQQDDIQSTLGSDQLERWQMLTNNAPVSCDYITIPHHFRLHCERTPVITRPRFRCRKQRSWALPGHQALQSACPSMGDPTSKSRSKIFEVKECVLLPIVNSEQKVSPKLSSSQPILRQDCGKGDAVTVHATDTWGKWTFRSIHS